MTSAQLQTLGNKSEWKCKNSSFELTKLSNGFTKLDSLEHTEIAK